MEYLSKKIGNRYVVWFESTNLYLFMEEPAFKTMILFLGGISIENVSTWFSKKYDLPQNESFRFINEVVETINKTNSKIQDSNKPRGVISVNKPQSFYSSKKYKIHNKYFTFYYESAGLEKLIHGYFSPFATDYIINSTEFSFFLQNDRLVIFQGNNQLGCWEKDEFSVAKGKLFLRLLNSIYKKDENNWITIFHASSVSREDQCIIFHGLSGAGKSVLAAILAKHQFPIISDDYVPVCSEDTKVYKLPLPITIKPGGIKVLSDYYSELNVDNASEEIKLMPTEINHCNPSGYHAKAIIFVKYTKDHPFEFSPIPNDSAFEMMIADSWVSPLKENVAKLLNWFSSVPCYKMHYSDNSQMVRSIENLMIVGQL